MTEAQWLACGDPDALLEFLRQQACCRRGPSPTRRRLRLFACACCRRVWSSLANCSRRAAHDGRRRPATRTAYLRRGRLRPTTAAGRLVGRGWLRKPRTVGPLPQAWRACPWLLGTGPAVGKGVAAASSALRGGRIRLA